MSSFLNEHTGDNGKTTLTSSRDDGNGNPVTDIHIKGSSVPKTRETASVQAITPQEVDGVIASDWIFVDGYYDITTLAQGELSNLELLWSSDGVSVHAKEKMITFAPLTVNVASEYVQVKAYTETPTTVSVRLYLKT